MQFVVEGSVRRSGERIRITVQLVNGRTGQQMWSERYDRVLDDVFAIQDEIASSVAGNAGAQLVAGDMERAIRKAPSNLAAYEHVLRARVHYRLSTKADNHKARKSAEAAIELDPMFSTGHALLTFALTQASRGGWADDPMADLIVAREHGLKAVSLDVNDVWSHVALGTVESTLGHHDLAIGAFECAISLCPSGAFIYIGYANALCDADRPEDGLAAIHKGMQLDPRYPPMYLITEGRNFLALSTLHDSVPIDVQASLWPDPNPGFGGAVRLVEDPLSELIETDAEP